MARTPRIKPERATVEPTPRYCQFPNGCRPDAKPFASLTFKSASGFVWTESSCQGHQEFRSDQIRKDGGTLTDVRLLEGEAAS